MDIIDALRLEGKEPTVTTLRTKIIVAAKMLQHLLDPDFQLNVSELARQVGVSRQSLYSWGWLAMTVVGIACLKTKPGPKAVEPEGAEVTQLRAQLQQMQWDKDRLYFANRQLEREVATLKRELVELVERAIIVLRMSGKVSYRGIQECLHYLCGVHVSLAEIEAQVQQAGQQAQSVLTSLLAQVQVTWVAIDEVYLKEAGRQIYGLLVVDLESRLALTLQRAVDRQASTWYQLLKDLPQVRHTLQGLVADLARPYPVLVRRLARYWQRPLVLQDCNVHAMRHLFKLRNKALEPYRRAKQRYQAARQAWLDQPDDPDVQPEYQAARQLYRFERRLLKYVLGLQRQLVKALRQPSRPAAEAILTQTLAQLARLPTSYQPFVQAVTKFIVRHQPRLLAHFDHPGLAWTTNTAEGAFSLLRRFVTVYKAFSTQQGVQSFLALFLLYYNLKPQRFDEGQHLAPLARAGVQTNGNYLNYLGFPTPTRLISYTTLKRQVQKLSTEFPTLTRAA
jgi:transposase-like protein